MFKAKSRSDDTLLTVDFNLRKLNDVRTLQNPLASKLPFCQIAILAIWQNWRFPMKPQTSCPPSPKGRRTEITGKNRRIIANFAKPINQSKDKPVIYNIYTYNYQNSIK